MAASQTIVALAEAINLEILRSKRLGIERKTAHSHYFWHGQCFIDAAVSSGWFESKKYIVNKQYEHKQPAQVLKMKCASIRLKFERKKTV